MTGKGVSQVVLKCEEAKATGILSKMFSIVFDILSENRDLKSCELVSIPAAVYFLVKDVEITQCSLAFNCLKAFPKKLPAKFQSLKVLSIRGNCITEIPEEIMQLSSIQAIDLSENEITSLNSELFANMKALKILNVGFNKIEKFDLKKIVKELPNLTKLIISGNPLDDETAQECKNHTTVIFEKEESQ